MGSNNSFYHLKPKHILFHKHSLLVKHPTIFCRVLASPSSDAACSNFLMLSILKNKAPNFKGKPRQGKERKGLNIYHHSSGSKS